VVVEEVRGKVRSYDLSQLEETIEQLLSDHTTRSWLIRQLGIAQFSVKAGIIHTPKGMDAMTHKVFMGLTVRMKRRNVLVYRAQCSEDLNQRLRELRLMAGKHDVSFAYL